MNADGKARSEKIVTSIFESIELIARDPYLHPRFDYFYRIDFQVHSKVHFHDYRIVYQILNDEVIVLRVWHAARNPRKLKLT